MIILLAGVSIAAAIAVKRIPPLLAEVDRGLLPPNFEVTLSSVGEYTLWLHLKGRLGNQLHHGSGELPPGAKVFLFDASSGREISLDKKVSAEKNMGEDKAISLGVFRSEREDKTIEIKSSGLNSEVLLSVSPTSSRQVMEIVVLIAAVIVGSLILSTLIFVQLMRRRQGGR
ncbi:MAG: hypothetical protein P1U58_11980 [Verrucomicrobiales bacterium]|nr:hypothetical protein [Verrucomicrobiales bacterium]